MKKQQEPNPNSKKCKCRHDKNKHYEGMCMVGACECKKFLPLLPPQDLKFPLTLARQKKELDEIITFLKEHHEVDRWSGEIPDELQLINIIPKLQRLRKEL